MTPIFFNTNPYSLPKTAPRINAGLKSPPGIGELTANIIRINFLYSIMRVSKAILQYGIY